MLNDPDKQSESQLIDVRCYFVRERNALLVRGQFTPLYTDYYLHLMQHGLRYEETQDRLLKAGLAALTLDLASRPWKDGVAWTLNIQDPLLNLFVTGSNRTAAVTGRIFTESVKKSEHQTFHCQIISDGSPIRQSAVEFETSDIFSAVESYYAQSEQRPARLFDVGDEDYVMIVAQPGCDRQWLGELTSEAVQKIDKFETLSLLEEREYRFECGCSEDRFYPSLVPLSKTDLDDLFTGTGKTVANCPRCGADITLKRENFEAFLARQTEDTDDDK